MRASIGTNSDNVTLTVTVGGDTLLQGGSGGVARLGGNDTTGDGTVIVRAGQAGTGSLLLNDGRIGTVGNVTLEATAVGGQITQSSAGLVKATTLTTNSNSTTSLLGANTVTNLFATTAGGNITFNNAQSLTLGNAAITTPVGAQTVNILTSAVGADITIAGTTITDDFITLSPTGNVVTLGSLTGASVTTVLADLWTGGGGDLLWTNGANWSRGAAPTAAQTAIIPDLNGVGPTDTITIGSGTHVIHGLTSAENLAMAGGSLTVSGAASSVNGTLTVSGGTLTLDSQLTAAGGYVQTAGTVNGTSHLTIVGAGNSWTGGTMAGSGLTAVSAGATLAVGGGTITNAGTFAKTGGSGASVLTGLTLNNSGVLNIGSGELRLSSTSLSNTGSIDIASGAVFGIPLGYALTGGSLGGSGTVAGNLTNSGGTVKPGGAGTIGTLTVSGNYTQGAGGQLDIDLGGTGAGQADKLVVTGAASLDGALSVISANGFQGSPGDVADVVAAASRSGSFAAVGGAFSQPVTALYAGNSVRITLAPLGTNAWMVDADGDWNDPANWNLGHVPTAGENVLIDRPSGQYTVTMPSGAQDVRSLVSAENLALTGGSLSVQQDSAFNGVLTLAGGTLTGAGSKIVNDLVLSAGAISGTGNLSVLGAYTHTGGTIDIGGLLAVVPSAGDIRVGGAIRASAVDLVSPGALQIDAPVTAGGRLLLSSGGDTTIASNVTAGSQFVSVLGGLGSILSVDGATATAPQFDVTFTLRPQGGVFVNGTEGVLTSGSAGFFTGGNQPAVLGTTFRVVYLTSGLNGFGGPLQESAPVNQLVQSVTRSVTPSETTRTLVEESKQQLEDKVSESDANDDAKTKDEKRRSRQVCS